MWDVLVGNDSRDAVEVMGAEIAINCVESSTGYAHSLLIPLIRSFDDDVSSTCRNWDTVTLRHSSASIASRPRRVRCTTKHLACEMGYRIARLKEWLGRRLGERVGSECTGLQRAALSAYPS